MLRTNVVFWLALVIGLLLASSAGAERYSGVSMPSSVRIGDRVLHLNGMGVHEATFFDIDVYVGGLYLERSSSDARAILDSEQAKRLVLRFKRDVSRADVGETIGKLRRRVGGAQMARLVSRVGEIREGDTLSITELPDHTLELRQNERLLAAVQGRGMCRDLFSNWLGPDPVSRRLKRRLLGHH